MKIAQPFVLAALLIASPAYAADKRIHTETDVRSDAKGNYEGTSTYEATDATGTKHKSNIEESESVTAGGGKKIAREVNTSTDPKGLMNKTWSERELETRADPDGNIRSTDRTRAVDAAGTRHDVKQTAKTTVDADGTSRTTVAKKSVTDPKGLLNKETRKTEETVTRAANGQIIDREAETGNVTAR